MMKNVLFSLLSVRIVFRDLKLTYNYEGLCLKRIQENIFECSRNPPLPGFEITSFICLIDSMSNHFYICRPAHINSELQMKKRDTFPYIIDTKPSK